MLKVLGLAGLLALSTSTLAVPTVTPPAGATPGVAAAGVVTAPAAVATKKPAKHVSAWRGVNWADPRDNYAHDAVVPSGLSTSDSYRQVARVATTVATEFEHDLGANTIRLPINPWSVGTDWWASYRGAIDAITRRGDKVILSYWEADDSTDGGDGKVDDLDAWNAMWDTVVKAYRKNKLVYFEPMNEPWGYAPADWISTCADWLARHPGVPRGRVIVSGTGFNWDVTTVGAAPELKGTRLSFHYYPFFGGGFTTEKKWLAFLKKRIGAYASRTIITETGAPMTSGLDYGDVNSTSETAFLNAMADLARRDRMGLVYWPGLRTDDGYALERMTPKGKLVVTNKSGRALVRRGWGY